MTRSIGASLASLFIFAALPALAADLRVADGRTPPPLPGTSMMAGYFTLTNEGPEPVTVTGAASDDFARVSMHRSIEEDGQARMESIDALTVEAGERVAFEPGGLHLMLFEPGGDPEVGNRLQVMLKTDAGPVAVTLEVVERSELQP